MGKQQQTGLSLVEVLVAVLILCIGLLGIAALQANGLKFNHDAYLRSQATALTYEIADRMRANQQAANNGAYDLAVTDGPPGTATIADQDLTEWLANLSGLLPSGDGSVVRVGNRFTITVQWANNRMANEGPLQTFQIITEL